MNKEKYVAPTMEVIEMEPCMVLASSSVSIFDKNTGGDDGKGGYDPGSSLSNERRGSWGNLWNEGN